MKRRDFLTRTLHWATRTGTLASVPAWTCAALGPGQNGNAARRVIVIFLRGAVDGLHVLAPYAEPAYARARPTLALARPGQDGGVLDLDGHFGLHPALAELMPLWQSRRLGFVHASGSPLPTRSHFSAQDEMESADFLHKRPGEGWLNRLLGELPQTHAGAAAMRGVSVGPVLPRIFAGPQLVSTLESGAGALKPRALDRPRVGAAFSELYAGQDELSAAYQQAAAAHRELMSSMTPQELEAEMTAASGGAPLPGGFPQDAARLASLMRKDARIQLAFTALGGWDTHANQGGATGQLASRLAALGQGLAVLARQLGPVLDDTVVMVMSEFGRTVRQNGNRGTDHGHGNVMWLMGGGVAGGQVHGRWPGLEDSALYEGRDLAVTTDFRQVISQVCERHLGLSQAAVASLFPGWSPDASGPRVISA